MKLKMKLAPLVVLFFTLCSWTAFAGEPSTPEKVYIPDQHILIAEKGIVVMINKQIYLTNTISKDVTGYYVMSDTLMQPRLPWDLDDRWECEVCGWMCDGERDYYRHLYEEHGYRKR